MTAVSRKAFGQALGMLGKRGTMALFGLPPGTFELDIFARCCLARHPRLDRRHPDGLAECLQFAGDGKSRGLTVEPLRRSTASSPGCGTTR